MIYVYICIYNDQWQGGRQLVGVCEVTVLPFEMLFGVYYHQAVRPCDIYYYKKYCYVILPF